MKKLISVITVLILCLLPLASCTNSGVTDNEEKLSIISTIFPGYDLARQITADAGLAVELEMLLPPGSESHDYEASLSDIAMIGKADLIICVGGETDEWIDAAIEASESRAVLLRLTDMVPLYEENAESILEDDHEHEHEDGHTHVHDEESDEEHDHSGYDEHVWTSPANAAVMCEKICNALCTLSAEDRELFEANTASYTAELRSLDENFREAAQNAERDTLIFADRFPFRYLTESMGVQYYAAFSGCSSDAEPSLATIYHLAEKVRELDAPVIFTIEFSSGYAAHVIADETEASVKTLHSCHNVSKADLDAGVTYLDLMKQNLEVIKEALN